MGKLESDPEGLVIKERNTAAVLVQNPLCKKMEHAEFFTLSRDRGENTYIMRCMAMGSAAAGQNGAFPPHIQIAGEGVMEKALMMYREGG